jgi:chromosome partitioning protein
MEQGRTYVITLRKGGVGKTTVAMNLAIYLRQVGREVAFLDLDPQRDGFDFFRERARLRPDLPDIASMSLEEPQKVESAMRSLVQAGADAVVDCPPLDPPQAIRAQEIGDILVFPFKAGGNNLRAFSRALSLYQAQVERERSSQSRRGGPQMFALLNEFMHGQVNDKLLLKWIQGSGIFQFAGCLGRRIEFKDAIAKRQAVWEYAPGSASAQEALAVCEALHRSGR